MKGGVKGVEGGNFRPPPLKTTITFDPFNHPINNQGNCYCHTTDFYWLTALRGNLGLPFQSFNGLKKSLRSIFAPFKTAFYTCPPRQHPGS